MTDTRDSFDTCDYPCPDCGEPHTEGFDGADFGPPDFEPVEAAWERGLNIVVDGALAEVEAHLEETGATPRAACMFVLHSDGTVTISGGGSGAPSDTNLALALVCDAVREKLAADASRFKAEELMKFIEFIEALAILKR